MKIRLLVVDDDPDITEVIALALGSDEFDVTRATDGIEALPLAALQPFDAVLSDVVMPKVDGIELTRALKKLDPTLPIFLMSGFAYDRSAEATAAGAMGFFEKPIPMAELVLRIKRAVASRRGSTP